jgi:hypothetical protein
MQYFPNNTTARFTTKLENAISLSGDWEVGLIEIQYPHTWHNIQANNCEFTYWQNPRRYSNVFAGPSDRKTRQIPPGYYESMSDIVQVINTYIKETSDEYSLTKYPLFKYDTITKTLKGEINLGATIEFSATLCFILGIHESQIPIRNINYAKYEDFKKAGYDVPNVQWESEYIGDINPEFSCIYVYCNLLQHVAVGDSKAQLLRVVNVEGKSGDNVHNMYERAIYLPIERKSFDSIEIDMRGDTDKPIPFESGKSFVILHFRQCKNNVGPSVKYGALLSHPA